MTWLIGIAAGLSAAWLLDALKPFIAIPRNLKPLVVLAFCVAHLVGDSLAGLLDKRYVGVSLGAALGTAKLLHAITSRLQAAKDKDRVETLEKAGPSLRRRR